MKRVTTIAVLFLVATVLAACSQGATRTYNLAATGASGTSVSGTATFEKVSATETRITLDLVGTQAGQTYPAHIHVGDVTPGGAIYVSLTSVDGSTGESVTVVTQTDAGAAITYEDLIVYDGYINIHLPADPSIIVANGEVGALP